MTGHLERPSQEAPENRKAKISEARRRKPASPRDAVRSLHAAERALLLARHRAAVADKRASIAAAFVSLLSAAEQRIIAHVQGRIASVDPDLPISARMAEIERLRAEQEAALLRLRQDIAGGRRAALRSAMTALSSAFCRERAGLSGRHCSERLASARTGSSSVAYGSYGRRVTWTAVRALAATLAPRNTDGGRRRSIRKGIS